MGRLVRQKGGLPLYAQLAGILRELINREELGPDRRLPSEPELVARYGISRATSAKALDVLEKEGLVQREQGRGTFVRDTVLERPLPELTSFTEHVTKAGYEPGQRLLSVERARAEEVGLLASLFETDLEVVAVRRVRLVDGEPVGLHRTVLPAVLAARIGFVEERLRKEQLSLYAQLRKHGLELAWAEEHLQARVASEEEASLLEVPAGEALINVCRFSYDRHNNLVEAVDAVYIGRRYDYRVTLVRRVGGFSPGA
jgi:DNA-binding GntR family transcriptional regulator